MALLGYLPSDVSRAAFWPLADFSPEWQAARWAAASGVALAPIDIPMSWALTESNRHGVARRADPRSDRAARRRIWRADLTAVAAGPLAYAVAQDLRRLADQESRGAAGVFRFSPTSLRRAYDLGWSAGDVHDWLARHSVTPVPQPLHYLVDDVARRHGGVRIGPALSYVRLEDEASGGRAADPAGCRRRRAAGHRADGAGRGRRGGGVARAAAGGRTRPGGRGRLRPGPYPAGRPAHSPHPVGGPGAGVADAAASWPPPCWPANAPIRHARPRTLGSTDAAVNALRSATQEARPVRVRYVTADGQSAERELAPLDLGAGAIRAVDRDTAQVVTIPLARISSVFPVIPRRLD